MTLATHEEIVDAEIVPTKMEAVASIERAIEHAEGFWKEILWQVQNRVWEALNYESFDALWEHRYAGLGVRIDRRERPELVAELRQIGQTQQEIADKLGVEHRTVKRDVAELRSKGHLSHSEPTITNSRGQSRPATYKKKEKEMPATLVHDTPYKPGHELVVDRGAAITVGEDGRATSDRPGLASALDWWRENPRMQGYEAQKASGMPAQYINRAAAALRKNNEIPKVAHSGRSPIEEFGLMATAVKNLGLSVDKLFADGVMDYIDADEMDYYMDGLRVGMKSLRKFQQLAQQISNN